MSRVVCCICRNLVVAGKLSSQLMSVPAVLQCHVSALPHLRVCARPLVFTSANKQQSNIDFASTFDDFYAPAEVLDAADLSGGASRGAQDLSKGKHMSINIGGLSSPGSGKQGRRHSHSHGRKLAKRAPGRMSLKGHGQNGKGHGPNKGKLTIM